MTTNNTETIIKYLNLYNEWRRGDEKMGQPNPTEIGKLIDEACEKLVSLERERDEWAAMCGRYKQERDEALMDRANGDIATITRNHYERILRERNEAREKLDEEMKWHHRTHTELVQTQCKILDMQMGRDEIQEKYDNLATEHMLAVNKLCEERDEAREQINRYRYNLDLLPIKWDI